MKILYYLLITILLVGCKPHQHSEEEQKTTEAHDDTTHSHNGEEISEIHLNETQVKIAGIKTEQISKQAIRERIAVTGTIEPPPQSKVTLYAPMEAFVYKSNLLPGDKVKKGQVVATLQHPNFTQLQYAYIEAVNKLAVVKADYERKKMLFENDITSKKSFQITKAAYQSATSLVQNYATQLKMAGISPTTVKNKGIQQYIAITAPISGNVTKVNMNMGKLMNANEEMMEIIDTDHMHAELNVFANDVLKIKKGTDFEFTPAGLEITYKGYVKLVSQAVDEQTKTVNVHGHFEDEKALLKAGMFVNAQILTSPKEVFALPEKAIVDIKDERFIFAAKANNAFEIIKIITGASDKGYIELKDFPKENSNANIVVNGAYALKGKYLELTGGDEGGHAH